MIDGHNESIARLFLKRAQRFGQILDRKDFIGQTTDWARPKIRKMRDMLFGPLGDKSTTVLSLVSQAERPWHIEFSKEHQAVHGPDSQQQYEEIQVTDARWSPAFRVDIVIRYFRVDVRENFASSAPSHIDHLKNSESAPWI